MTELKIDSQGLLIPPQFLQDLPEKVQIRAIKGGFIIESAKQVEVREKLQAMVGSLRNVADGDGIGEADIAEMVEQVRKHRADNR